MQRSVHPGEAFLALCESLRVACSTEVVARYPGDGSGLFFLEVARRPGEPSFTVRRAEPIDEQVSRWDDCVRRRLVGATAPEPALTGNEGWVQCFARAPDSPLDVTKALAAARTKCLQDRTWQLKVEYELVLERTRTRVEHVRVVQPERVDAYERRCIELALDLEVSLPPDDRYATPQREPRTSSVSGRTAGGELPALPTAQIASVQPPPPATPAHAQAQLLIDEAAELPVSSLDERLALLKQCVERAPDYAECYVRLGAAWARKSGSSPEAARDARLAYQRFVELAPTTDPRVPRVQKILALP
jgi:hypothetical protein